MITGFFSKIFVIKLNNNYTFCNEYREYAAKVQFGHKTASSLLLRWKNELISICFKKK